VICASCRLKLIETEKGSPRILTVQNLSRLCNPMITQSVMDSTSCRCIICQVAKAKLNDRVSVNQFLQDISLPNKIPPRTEYPLCRNCFADLVPGHECGSKRETLENLHQNIHSTKAARTALFNCNKGKSCSIWLRTN
jgi:hypothetical protein